MNNYIQDWENSQPLKELFAMAEGIPEKNLIDLFTVMLLDNNGDNDFALTRLNYIKRNEHLNLFTDIIANRQGIAVNTRSEQSTENVIRTSSQIEEQKEISLPPKEILATVIFSGKGMTTVKLIDSKDNNTKTLKDIGEKIKLKTGDIVFVKKSIKKDELIFLKKQV